MAREVRSPIARDDSQLFPRGVCEAATAQSGRERLPGYQLVIERSATGAERLNFIPISVDPMTAALRRRDLATREDKL